MPEHGLCRFATQEAAGSYVTYLSSSACAEPFEKCDLIIEPYDLEEHERLIAEHPLPSAWEHPI
jgi:hypothetical protein